MDSDPPPEKTGRKQQKAAAGTEGDSNVTEAQVWNQFVEAEKAIVCQARDRAIMEIALQVERGDTVASPSVFRFPSSVPNCQESLKPPDLGA